MSLRAQLASQSAVIFAARLVGAGLTFLTQVGIARFLGSAVLGDYLVFVAAINLIAFVMPLGFQTVGSYFAAEYRARGQGRVLWRFVLRTYGHALLTGALIFGFGAPFAAMIGTPGEILLAHWLAAMVMAVAISLVFINGGLLVGLKRPLAGFLADALFRPLVLVGALLWILAAGSRVEGLSSLLNGFAFGFLGVALVHLVLTLVSVARAAAEGPAEVGSAEAEPGGPAGHESRRWWRFAIPWVIIGLFSDFFFDIDLLLLADMLGRAELAVFGVCARIFSLIAFGVAVVYAVTLPHMFEDEVNADWEGFNRKVGDANLVALGLSVLLFVLTALFGPLVLLLFGAEFTTGAVPLAILSLVLVVRAALGPGSLVLSIHDRPYASLPAIGLGLLCLILANWMLVPVFGLVGAAVAALIAFTMWSGTLWLTARISVRIDVSVFPRLAAWRQAKPSKRTAPSA